MAFPWVAAAFFAASTIQNIQGQAQADRDQSSAAKKNASFFREQSDFIRAAGFREKKIFERTGEELISAQMGAVARSAASFSGSFVITVAQTEALIQEEANAIAADTEHRARLATLRAVSADQEAKDIPKSSKQRQLGILLGGVGQIAAAKARTK